MALTKERLKELLEYNPDTGVFTRKVSVGGQRVGSIAGCTNKQGYICIRVDDTLYLAHRLAFLYMTGEFPDKQVDHFNRRRDDNRWANLSEVTARENHHNRSDQAAERCLVEKTPGRFTVYIWVDGKRVCVGTADIETAIRYRDRAEDEIARFGCIKTLHRARKYKYKGVDKEGNKFRARIAREGTRYHLGCYNTEEAAAKAFNLAAKRYEETGELTKGFIQKLKEEALNGSKA